MRYNIELRRCKPSAYPYKVIRDRHYIPNNGAVGQQLHYLILLDDEVVGIISAGSSVFAVAERDKYFGIEKNNRSVALNSIVDNTVFRLEKNLPNLGTQILKLWRKTVQVDWKKIYGVDVAGFEMFIIENDRRKGALYKADNWTYVGETAGSTKQHNHGITSPSVRKDVCKKLIFCKTVRGKTLATEYFPSWNKQSMIKGQISMFDEKAGDKNEL